MPPTQILFLSLSATDHISIGSLKVTAKPSSGRTLVAALDGTVDKISGGVVSTLKELNFNSSLRFPDLSVTVSQHAS